MSEANSLKPRRRLYLYLALLALVCYFAAMASTQMDEQMNQIMPETVINCSSYNGNSSGYKGLYQLVEKLGIKVARFENPYREIAAEKGILLVAAPNFPMKAAEAEHVLNWVAGGNSLIYLDYCMYGSAAHFLDKLKLKARVSKNLSEQKFDEIPDSDEMQHVKKLLFSSETRLDGGRALLRDSRGALFVELPYGKGRCLFGTVPSLCSNRRFSDRESWGNFQFLINWIAARGGKVLFDERVHGHTSARSLFSYVASGPAGAFVFQIGLLVLIAILSLNQRFGGEKAIPQKRKIAAAEYIDGMALTFEKGRAYDAAFAILYGAFHNRLCKALSISPAEKAEEIAALWSHSANLNAVEAKEFLLKAEHLQKERNINAEELLAIMKEQDRLFDKSKVYLPLQGGRRLGG
ncbi:MAG: DUF4350 domain-containing protein [Candidatus Obscuribacterales bacterium]|nr:DUF4350 domain-containing protein [Candidatus Obscuribacterales bacterium]